MSQDTDQPQQQEQGAQPAEQQQQQQPAAPAAGEQDKNVDKKEIADEEREKMLNAENNKHTGAAPGSDLEAEEQKPKRKIPIGGIKMPGFCRSKSKEPCKDDDTKPIENDGEAKDAEDKGAAKEVGRTGRFIQAIRVPLSNVFSRKKKVWGYHHSGIGQPSFANISLPSSSSASFQRSTSSSTPLCASQNYVFGEADAELGTTGASAGLASAETLDGVGGDNQEKTNNAAVGDDGMETVRLDVEAGDSPPLKPHPFFAFLNSARRNHAPSISVALIILTVMVILFFACLGPRPTTNLPVIDGKIRTSTCGLVEGVAEESAYIFRGIPYARPPVNELRWKRAEPLERLEHCWNGTKKAFNSSQMCWQRTEAGMNGAEDCLYLDIYTPKVDMHRPVAVVVMIGADTLSGPSPGIMQPSGKLAHEFDMVFVRPNFRLDVFGFLAADPLTREANPATSGNYGLYDIITVLKWVQLNIEHFGGDKSQVTVWGHRAGGTLVTALLGARQAKGLFSKAWISSASANFPTKDLVEYQKMNQPFLNRIGCDNAVCLRNKKAEQIMEAVPSEWLKPNDGLPTKEGRSSGHPWLVKDDDMIQQHIGEILKVANPFKIMFGTTAQSGTLAPLKYNTTDEDPKKIDEKIRDSLFASSKNYTDLIFSKYNKTLKALHTMISEVRVVCPLMSYALMNNNTPFYVSTFPRGFAADADSDAAAILGFFERDTVEKRRHYTAIQQLFKDFVYQGKVKDLQVESGKRVLVINQDVHIETNYDNCNFWLEKGSEYGRLD